MAHNLLVYRKLFKNRCVTNIFISSTITIPAFWLTTLRMYVTFCTAFVIENQAITSFFAINISINHAWQTSITPTRNPQNYPMKRTKRPWVIYIQVQISYLTKCTKASFSWDALPPSLVKSRSREIGCFNYHIALKFDRHLDSATTERCLSNFRAIGKV